MFKQIVFFIKAPETRRFRAEQFKPEFARGVKPSQTIPRPSEPIAKLFRSGFSPDDHIHLSYGFINPLIKYQTNSLLQLCHISLRSEPFLFKNEFLAQIARYTDRDSKIGFGLPRKLPIIDDRRLKPSWSVLINTNQLAIVDYRGFSQPENPIFESRSV
jgi:hypothetical protein